MWCWSDDDGGGDTKFLVLYGLSLIKILLFLFHIFEKKFVRKTIFVCQVFFTLWLMSLSVFLLCSAIITFIIIVIKKLAWIFFLDPVRHALKNSKKKILMNLDHVYVNKTKKTNRQWQLIWWRPRKSNIES